MIDPLLIHYGKIRSHQWRWKLVEGAMLGNTGISRMARNTLSWTYFLKLDCMDKREVTSSWSNDYIGRPGKSLNTSLAPKTKSSNKKQREKFSITEITNQDFTKLLKKFKNSPYLDYKSKQVHNEPTDYYLFLIKQITNMIKIERHCSIQLF